MKSYRTFIHLALLGVTFSSLAKAQVVISGNATRGMSCSAGMCVPTAPSAMLNAGDLAAMLKTGSVDVSTTGSGVQAESIVVGDSVEWSTAFALTLDAYQSVTIDRPLKVKRDGQLSLSTNDGGSGGTLSFGSKGRVSLNASRGVLQINGVTYKLETSIGALASAMMMRPSGSFALADNYDASADGTYSGAAIQAPFNGSFSGLGNSISNVSIHSDAAKGYVGLFAAETGSVSSLKLLHVIITGGGRYIGTLAGVADGVVANVTASGSMNLSKLPGDGSDISAGGLIGWAGGSAAISQSTASVEINATTSKGVVGGLVGTLADGSASDTSATGRIKATNAAVGGLFGSVGNVTVQRSFATGEVSTGKSSTAGGLIAVNGGTVVNCYATGDASGGANSIVGGLVGTNTGSVDTSYATGLVSGNAGAIVAGFVGSTMKASFQNDYFDTTTSGVTNGVGTGSASGVTGLTSTQLQTNLPTGFSDTIWGKSVGFNQGFPYLESNPPLE